MKTACLAVLYFVFSVNCLLAQSGIIDSLKKELPKARHDTVVLSTLTELCQQYSNTGDNEKLKETADTLGMLADKLLDKARRLSSSELTVVARKFKANSLNFIGIYLIKNYSYEEAMKNLDASLKIREEINDRKGIASIYNHKGIIFEWKSDYDQALRYYTASLKMRQEAGDKAGLGDVYSNMGNVNANKGDFEEALKNQLLALRFRKEVGNTILIVHSYNNVANVYNSQGKNAEAMQYYDSAFKISKAISFMQGEAYYYSNVAGIYSLQGRLPEALRTYFAALKSFEKLMDRKGCANTCANIGGIFRLQSNYSDALSYFNMALDIYNRTGNKKGEANCHSSIGSVYDEQGKYGEALSSYLLALKIQKEIGDYNYISGTYINLGKLYQRQNNYSESLKNFHASLKISRATGNKKALAEAYLSIGEAEKVKGNYSEALSVLNKAKDLAVEMNNKILLQNIYKNLADVYTVVKEYKKAAESLALLLGIKDTVYSETSSRQMAEMKTRFETEKKEKEIALLNKDRELLKKEQEIKDAKISKQRAGFLYLAGAFVLILVFIATAFYLYRKRKDAAFRHAVLQTEMKALRSQMNPHFTFNVLNSIQYYVSENDLESAEIYLEKFSALIRMILDQSRSTYISLKQELTMLKLYLELEEMRFAKKFQYVLDVDPSLDPGRILLPGMLIQPLVENAIRHGIEHKEGEAVISVSFASGNSTLLCEVTDNGIGRAAAAKLNAGSTHRSAATSITRERIDALSSIYNIKLSYITEDLYSPDGTSAGTRVKLEIPYLTDQS